MSQFFFFVLLKLTLDSLQMFVLLLKKEEIKIEVLEEGKMKKLEVLSCIKVLGIHLDNEMNWNKQVKEVNKRAKFAVRNLNRVNQLLPLKSSVLLYNSLVACHLNYVDTVWAGCGEFNKNKLQRTQNCAAKSLLGMSKHESATIALKKTQLLPLDEKIKIHEAVYAYKSINGISPDAICKRYTEHKSLIDNRSTSRQILKIPRHKNEFYKNSPLYRTIRTWNAVPQEIKESSSATAFKHR